MYFARDSYHQRYESTGCSFLALAFHFPSFFFFHRNWITIILQEIDSFYYSLLLRSLFYIKAVEWSVSCKFWKWNFLTEIQLKRKIKLFHALEVAKYFWSSIVKKDKNTSKIELISHEIIDVCFFRNIETVWCLIYSGNGKLASWGAMLGFLIMMSLDVGLG